MDQFLDSWHSYRFRYCSLNNLGLIVLYLIALDFPTSGYPVSDFPISAYPLLDFPIPDLSLIHILHIHACVKVVEEIAPVFKNGGLIVCLCKLIVNVLKSNAL